MPMRIAFELPTTDVTFYLEMTIDIMFMIDILLNFNTGFYNKGQKVMQRCAIFKDYMSMWFWIDLVSTIPYTWILAYSQGLSIRAIESDDVALISPTEAIVGGTNSTNVTAAVNATAAVASESTDAASSALADAP